MKLLRQLIEDSSYSEDFAQKLFRIDTLCSGDIPKLLQDIELFFPSVIYIYKYTSAIIISIFKNDESEFLHIVSKLQYVIFCTERDPCST
jgi:hypothetical protein